jgi:hypothetical protein
MRLIARFCLVVFMFLVSTSLSFSQGIDNPREFNDGNLNEFQVKAAYLEKIIHFIDWPESPDMDHGAGSFVIGVFGKTPFKEQLEMIYTDRRVKNRRVEVRTISNIEEIPGCRVLFISRTSSPRLSRIVKYVRGKAVLTVGDTRGFCKWGVHITLFLQRGNIEFNINELEIQASGLIPNYRLFKHAAKIESPLRNRK